MAGRPKKRDKIERLKANGEITTPDPDAVVADVQDVELKPVEEKPKRRGRTPEEMREMTRLRLEMAKTDPSKLGGRPRTRRKKSEVEEDAINKLVPRAIQVLEEQLYDDDPQTRQRAAVKILEWGKGKPAQSVKVEGDSVHTIRYETVVALPEVVRELEAGDQVFDELTGGDIIDQEDDAA